MTNRNRNRNNSGRSNMRERGKSRLPLKVEKVEVREVGEQKQ